MPPLWTPDRQRIEHTRLTAFTRYLEARGQRALASYADLHALSVQKPDEFWNALWDFSNVIGDRGARVIDRPGAMPGTKFFPDGRINFAENLLRRRDSGAAIVATSERGDERSLTWKELAEDVARAAKALKDAGVKPGDRVCAIV